MKIGIIGSEGSMGKRYQAILKWLCIDYVCADVKNGTGLVSVIKSDPSHVILATPTDTHINYLYALSTIKVPVLCEKPISKDLNELSNVLDLYSKADIPLRMMMQYENLVGPGNGDTYYNYFRHGSDGLIWDCISIIGLAKGKIDLYETSPIWSCMINGQKIDQSKMDWAYVESVRNWLKEPLQDFSEILRIHRKTSELEKIYV